MSPARAGTSAGAAVLAATGLLLALVTWAASIGPERVASGGHLTGAEPQTPSVTPVVGPEKDPLAEERQERRSDPPAWLGAIAWAAELLTLAVAAFLVLRLLRRLRRVWRARPSRRAPPAPEVDFDVLGSAAHVSEAMVADAEAQRGALLAAAEPRNAIVECWHRFEQQAVRAGLARRPWQTTAEFVLEVLDHVGADRGAVARLADLYREARFSDHVMNDAHRGAALEALDVIHQSMRAGVPA